MNLPKRASSVVRTALDSPVSDIEFGNSDKARKAQIKASQSSVKDEEEYRDHNVIDHAWSQQVSSRVSLIKDLDFQFLSNPNYQIVHTSTFLL